MAKFCGATRNGMGMSNDSLSPDATSPRECATLGGEFERVAARRPAHLAIQAQDGACTYGRLNGLSNGIAARLQAQSLNAAGHVILLFHPGIDAFASMLACLKLGRVYVPLDPDSPESRTRAIIADCEGTVLLTSAEHHALACRVAGERCSVEVIDRELLESHESNPAVGVTASSLAYILYTSGSTGHPKGVLQTHRNVLHFVRSYARCLGIGPEDRLTMLYSLSFSASVMDIFGALLSGATLYPYRIKDRGLAPLGDWLCENQISILHTVPTVFRQFVAQWDAPPPRLPIRAIDLGGEPVLTQDVVSFQANFPPSCCLINHLAFTEASVAAQFRVDHQTKVTSATVPVGHDTAGVKLLIVDEAGNELPHGVTGKIEVHSPFVSPGYWRQPALTEQSFSESSLIPGARVYKSGDRGYRTADGQLVHQGRADACVKIRGYSIEIAEIEQALLQCQGICMAVVAPFEWVPKRQQLVAYCVIKPGAQTDESQLRSRLAAELPDYMVPAQVVFLDRMPLTATGKIDRNALPPPKSPLQGMAPDDASATPVERHLLSLWRDVLGRNDISLEANFLDCGGDSLLAVEMLAEVERTLGMRIPPSKLIEAPNVRSLARVCEEAQVADDSDSCLVALQVTGSLLPFFCVPPAARTVLIFRGLANRLGADQPFYSFQHLGMEGRHRPHDTVGEMASRYIAELRLIQPQGPYHLGGMCFGGFVALEMARRLKAAGQTVGYLAMLDVKNPPGAGNSTNGRSAAPSGLGILSGLKRLFSALHPRSVNSKQYAPNADTPTNRLSEVFEAHWRARRDYVLPRYHGRITLFQTDDPILNANQEAFWSECCAGNLEVIQIAGMHRMGRDSFIREPSVTSLAEAIRNGLRNMHGQPGNKVALDPPTSATARAA